MNWISIEERMPEEFNKDVLVIAEQKVKFAHSVPGTRTGFMHFRTTDCIDDVTHWIPIEDIDLPSSDMNINIPIEVKIMKDSRIGILIEEDSIIKLVEKLYEENKENEENS